MSIYQHFRNDEKFFIDSVQQWKDSVEKQYSAKLTSFLDPREQQILTAVIGNNEDCLLSFSGGYEFAERKRAILYPSYYKPSFEDYEISLLEINYNSKFLDLRHQQVLGTLMSLGLTREKFGDVMIADQRAQIIVAEDISDYVLANVTKIGSAGVSLKKRDISNIMIVQNTWHTSMVTSSSLRIDSLLSSFAAVSRKKSQDYIAAGKVKVNHKIVEDNDFECQEGDLISARGFGRFQVMEILGKSKKDKWKITFGKQK